MGINKALSGFWCCKHHLLTCTHTVKWWIKPSWTYSSHGSLKKALTTGTPDKQHCSPLHCVSAKHNLSAGFSLSLNEITSTVSQARNFWLHPHPLYPINWLILLILKNFSGTSTPSRLSPVCYRKSLLWWQGMGLLKTLTILSKVFLFCLAMPSKELAFTRYWVGKEEILFSHPAPSFQLL